MASSIIPAPHQDEQPISRTYQYRKVMKPMLERKRRARINRCLDELKELLVVSLSAEGESVSRLEKADVLELTVRHLHKLRRSHQLSESNNSDRFRQGFVHCAQEVGKFLTAVSPASVDIGVSSRLVSHLDHCIRGLDVPSRATHLGNFPLSPPILSPGQHPPQLNILINTPPSSPVSSMASHHSGSSFFDLSSSPRGTGHALSLCTKGQGPAQQEPFDLSSGENMWRPW